MKKQEDIIRDYLADHIEWLQPGLKVRQKEYLLDNQSGTKGYIDILAYDEDRNFVIIEIKRSDKAARETLNEINKYIGLLKQNYRVKESEIKCLIVAVEWKELLVPFSEFVTHSKYYIRGIALKVNEAQIPISFSEVTPLSDHPFSRGYSPFHILLEYREKASREEAYPEVCLIIQNCGIQDVVFLFVENLEREEIIYPYGICIGFQQFPIEEYVKIMERNNYEIGMTEEDWEDYSEEDKLLSLYGSFIAMFQFWKVCDTSETVWPEVFSNMISTSGWKVTDSEKWGIFQVDPRYDHGLMMAEFAGGTGGNSITYVNTAESDHILKIEEIRKNFRFVLGDLPEWEGHIDHILDDLQEETQKFRLTVSICNPSYLLAGLVQGYKENSENYLPTYCIQADFGEIVMEFHGFVVWNGKIPDICKCVNWFERNQFYESLILGENKEFLMRMLELVTFHGIGIFKNGTPVKGGILNYNGRLEDAPVDYIPIKEYFKYNIALMRKILYYVGR